MPAELPWLSALNAPLCDGFFGVFPFVLVVAGPALGAYAPFHRASVEERVKGRRMTAAEARRHLTFLRVASPALFALGLAQIVLRFCAASL